MYKILPQYFSNIATDIVERKKIIEFNLNCTCGNHTFFIFKNVETSEENIKRKKWESLVKKYNNGGYSDNEGNLYLTKNLFGIKIKQIKINKSEIPKYITIFKAKRSNCGKEYIIFDSRINGYNALVDKLDGNKTNDLPINYKKFLDKEKSIKIKITNELSLDEFVNEFQNNNIRDFSNAFSEISIYIDHNNKYKCIFTTETR